METSSLPGRPTISCRPASSFMANSMSFGGRRKCSWWFLANQVKWNQKNRCRGSEARPAAARSRTDQPQAVVGHLEDRGLGVLVDRHDHRRPSCRPGAGWRRRCRPPGTAAGRRSCRSGRPGSSLGTKPASTAARLAPSPRRACPPGFEHAAVGVAAAQATPPPETMILAAPSSGGPTW